MNTTTERLIEIENERAQTMSDPSFQSWMKDLGVGSVYRNPEPRHRARDLNAEYNFSKLFPKAKLGSYLGLLFN
jgi:hypothetical protein